MLVAIFWQQLSIQIVVADSVADSKTKVRTGKQQLVAGCRFEKVVIINFRVQIVTIYAPGSETKQALALFKKMIVAMFWK